MVVSGAHAGKFSAVLPGFGIGKAGVHPSAHMSRPVTRLVEPPPPALAAGRLEGVGQLGRRVPPEAHAPEAEPLVAAPAERLGRCAAVVAGGCFTLAWPADGQPWATAPPADASLVRQMAALGSESAGGAGHRPSVSPLLYATSFAPEPLPDD